MKTALITLSSNGNGMSEALTMTEKLGTDSGLGKKPVLHLRLLAEELFGMLRGIAGDFEAGYWIESEKSSFELHMKSEINLTEEAREQLLAASSSGENTAAKGVTGKLRDLFERFLEPENGSIPRDLVTGMDYAYSGADFGTLSVAAAGLWSMNRYKTAVKEGRAPQEDWDELEKSIVANLADDVQIGIAGQNVEMTITKKF